MHSFISGGQRAYPQRCEVRPPFAFCCGTHRFNSSAAEERADTFSAGSGNSFERLGKTAAAGDLTRKYGCRQSLFTDKGITAFGIRKNAVRRFAGRGCMTPADTMNAFTAYRSFYFSYYTLFTDKKTREERKECIEKSNEQRKHNHSRIRCMRHRRKATVGVAGVGPEPLCGIFSMICRTLLRLAGGMCGIL